MKDISAKQPHARIAYASVAPEVLRAMYAVESYVRACGLARALLELVKSRASQINGCAYCVDVHTKDARGLGETERLYAVVGWREAPFFTDRERAALASTEAVTLVSRDQIPDEIYEQARAVQREGTGGSHHGSHYDQRMGPTGG